MTNQRLATLAALADLPEGVWIAYLLTLRGVNRVLRQMVLDDPTQCIALEAAIALELHEHAMKS